VIAEPVAPVEPDSIFEWASQGRGGPHEDRNGGTTKLDSIESILRCLIDRVIARDDSDREDTYVRRAERHDERHGIIRRGIGIDQELSRGVRMHCL
jgi:hypothetical protein